MRWLCTGLRVAFQPKRTNSVKYYILNALLPVRSSLKQQKPLTKVYHLVSLNKGSYKLMGIFQAHIMGTIGFIEFIKMHM